MWEWLPWEWAEVQGQVAPKPVPIDERCWKCDRRRVLPESVAGLCGECREELRAA